MIGSPVLVQLRNGEEIERVLHYNNTLGFHVNYRRIRVRVGHKSGNTYIQIQRKSPRRVSDMIPSSCPYCRAYLPDRMSAESENHIADCMKRYRPDKERTEKEKLEFLASLDKNPIISEVMKMLRNQQEKGLLKYGKLVSTDNHTVIEWIEHAQQEHIDALVYLECIKQKMKEAPGK